MPEHSSSQTYGWLKGIVFCCLAVLVYLPALTVEFGFHNDYSMLLADRTNFLGFYESKHILMVGRAVGAVLATLQCWTMNRIVDFTFWRWISLGCMLIFTFASSEFLKRRCSLEPPWAWLASWLVVTLPVTQMSVLWVAHFMPGSFNVLLAMISYFLFQVARGKGVLVDPQRSPIGSISMLAVAFLLFVGALFIYPPTALTVFVFTFAIVLLYPSERWTEARKIFLGDVLFWGLGMLAYRLIDRMIIYPWGVLDAKFHIPTQTEYDMRLTSHWAAKGQLLLQSWLDAAAGAWHLVFGGAGAVIFFFVAGWAAFELISRNRKPDGSTVVPNLEYCQRGGALLSLLFLANLPSFVAEGCFKVLGYRVLWPGAVMFTLAFVVSLKYLNRLEQEDRSKENLQWGATVPVAVVALVILSTVFAARNVSDSVRNDHLELRFVRSQLKALNLEQVQQVIVIPVPKGVTLIGRNMPYEFGYMITEFQHVAPIILQDLKARIAGERQLNLKMVDPNSIIKLSLTDSDFLININQMREDLVPLRSVSKPAAPLASP